MINPRHAVELTFEGNSIIIISIHPRSLSGMTSLKRSPNRMKRIFQKLDAGDVIAIVTAFFALVTAIFGLVLQSQSLDLAREQLDRDIIEVNELARDLKEQRGEFIDEKIAQRNAQASSTQRTSEIHRQLLKIGRGERAITHELLSSLIISQSAVAQVSKSKDLPLEIRDEILDRALKLNASVGLFSSFQQQWEGEMEKLAIEHRAAFEAVATEKPLTSETPERLDKLNADYKTELDQLSGQYAEKLKPFREQFNSSRSALLELLTDGIKGEVPHKDQTAGEQDGAEQPANAPESKPKGDQKPQPESKSRSQ